MTTPKTTHKIRRRTAVDDASLPRVVDMDVGDRFKLSALGSQRCPRLASKVGIITATIQNSRAISIRFDGNKRSTSIHRDYIEPIESEKVK
jgi:hypothetical protein